MPRLVELPARGRLIVATDLQGNLADFVRVEERFEQAAARPDGAVMVVTGDLVHGPEIPESHWPPYLGDYYLADSPALLARAEALAARHPGRVHYLLGNHEHAHLGGPVVSKFFSDEAGRLERLLGPRRSLLMREWFASWPLVAVARTAGVLMLHAAPNAELCGADDLEHLPIVPPPERRGLVEGPLAEILWARTASTERARAFLEVFDPGLRVAVYGHDVAREGFAIDREPLLCISTSFGCHDGDKLYLDWDLAQPAASAWHLGTVGLRPLYPDAPPVYREVLACELAPSLSSRASPP